MFITASQLRAKLKVCLKAVDSGEEVLIIRNSTVVAKLVPAHATMGMIKAARKVEGLQSSLELADGSQVRFREFGEFEDSGPVYKLRPLTLPFNCDQPAMYFQNGEGEFWVGELDGKVIAYGGFTKFYKGSDEPSSVAIEHVYVDSRLDGAAAIEQQLIMLLQTRLARRGYHLAG